MEIDSPTDDVRRVTLSPAQPKGRLYVVGDPAKDWRYRYRYHIKRNDGADLRSEWTEARVRALWIDIDPGERRLLILTPFRDWASLGVTDVLVDLELPNGESRTVTLGPDTDETEIRYLLSMASEPHRPADERLRWRYRARQHEAVVFESEWATSATPMIHIGLSRATVTVLAPRLGIAGRDEVRVTVELDVGPSYRRSVTLTPEGMTANVSYLVGVEASPSYRWRVRTAMADGSERESEWRNSDKSILVVGLEG